MAEAVIEKPIDEKILMTVVTEFQEYDPTLQLSCWADLNLKAPIFEEDDNKRAAVDIVAVIDRSGSMGGSKLELVKKTLHFVVSQLSPKDRLCLIIYDDSVDVVFPLTSITSENKDKIESQIDQVKTRGSTNLCGGLLKGMINIMDRTTNKADVASVLLLTDGLANVGIVTPEGILAAMKSPRNPGAGSGASAQALPTKKKKPSQNQNQTEPKKTKVAEAIVETSQLEPADIAKDFPGTVYTFGFGSDHNAALLKDISDAGGGVYYYIDTEEKVPESFANCLGGLLTTVGQNITLNIETINGAIIKEMIAKNTPKFNTEKTKADVSLGDLQSEEQRDILLEFDLPVCSNSGGIIKYATINLSYFNVITTGIETEKFDLMIDRANTGKPKIANDLIDKQKNRIATTIALEEAQVLAKAGKFSEGRLLLNECNEKIKASTTAQEKECIAQGEDLMDMIQDLENETTYKSKGMYKMANKIQMHKVQRSNYAEDLGSDDDDDDESAKFSYASKAKKGKARKAKKFI